MPEPSMALIVVSASLVVVVAVLFRHTLSDAVGHRVVETPKDSSEYQQLWDQLTVREREVAKLAVQGHRNRDIAKKLNISKNTVDSHIKNVYGKLGVHNRVELARTLHALGME